MTSDPQIAELVAQSYEELYRQLGLEVTGRQALPLDRRELVERGRRFFEAKRPILENAVCNSKNVKSFAEGKNEAAEIAVEVLKIISSLILPVSPVVLAVLVAKMGIKKFCRNQWQHDV